MDDNSLPAPGPAQSLPVELRRVVCPGSYDPVTEGHLDVIRRAAALFDEVVVAVMVNPNKTGTFDPATRRSFIEQAVADQPRVRVEVVDGGLLVDYCRRIGAVAVVKGLRGGTDFAYELPMALMNRHMTGLETVFVPGDPKYGHVSSSLVKEVAGHGADVTGLVPEAVRQALEQRRTRGA